MLARRGGFGGWVGFQEGEMGVGVRMGGQGTERRRVVKGRGFVGPRNEGDRTGGGQRGGGGGRGRGGGVQREVGQSMKVQD